MLLIVHGEHIVGSKHSLSCWLSCHMLTELEVHSQLSLAMLPYHMFHEVFALFALVHFPSFLLCTEMF
jgi:hypothetical protein